MLDLSKVIAGPLCGQYLGELGAEVIKVEPPDTGDDTRSWLPQDQGISATFLAVNHNKRSITLDLKHPEARAVVQRLVSHSDVLLQGFGGGTAARLGVDYDTVWAYNNRLVYCDISGYGRDGPKGMDPGYDVMLQAFSGMLATMGDPEGGLARASFSPIDMATAIYGLSGIMAALMERDRTGEGMYLEVCLLDTAMGLMSYPIQNFWRSGKLPRRMGTAHPAMAPYQAFQASDGSLMIGVGNDSQWRRFCKAAGLAELADHPDYATNPSRVARFDEVVALVQTQVSQKPVQEWLSLLQAAGVPCAPINTLEQAVVHPQVIGRDLIVESEHPVLGTIRNVGLPIRFRGEARRANSTPPLLGEHTEEVLAEVGYSEEEVAELRACGAIGAAGANVP